jgi:osmotically inducible lipoprotein OsmB
MIINCFFRWPAFCHSSSVATYNVTAGELIMTMTRYIMLALFLAAVLSYSSKISDRYESATIGATIGGVAGAILSSGTPLGMIGGAAVGGWIGDQMQATATPESNVVTLRQAKSLNSNG